MVSGFSENTPINVSTRATFAWAALFFVLAVGATLARGPWDSPLLVDNQHYFYMSERAASGVAPHIAHFDPKTTLSIFIAAAGIKVGRILDLGTDLDSARFISVVFAGLSASMAWWCAWVLTRSRLAAHVAGIVIIGTPLFLTMALMSSRPKVFMVPFLLAPVIATAKHRPFWAGFFSACAFLCWQPCLLVIGGAVVAALLHPRTALRNLALITAGAVIPVAAYEGYYWMHGALAEQIEQSFHFPSNYMNHEARPQVYWLHAKWIFRWQHGPTMRAVYEHALPLALLGALMISLGKPKQFFVFLRDNPGWCHALAVAPVALLFTLHDYQGFPDKFLLLPWIALSAGVLVATTTRGLSARIHQPRLRNAVVAAVLALAAVPAITGLGSHLRSGLPRQQALSVELARYFDQGKSVYVIGCTHLLAFLRRSNHVRYGFFFRGMSEYMRTKTNSPDGYRPLNEAGEMPDVIVVSRGFLPGGRSWLNAEYEERRIPKFESMRIRVYERIVPAAYWGEPPLGGLAPIDAGFLGDGEST